MIPALVLFLLATGNIALWIETCRKYSDAPFEEVRAAYLSYFPYWLQNAQLLTLINILLLAGAGGLFFRAMAAPGYRRTNLLLAILSAILLAWNIFSLM